MDRAPQVMSYAPVRAHRWRRWARRVLPAAVLLLACTLTEFLLHPRTTHVELFCKYCGFLKTGYAMRLRCSDQPATLISHDDPDEVQWNADAARLFPMCSHSFLVMPSEGGSGIHVLKFEIEMRRQVERDRTQRLHAERNRAM